MKALLIQGSARGKSNTGAMLRFLQARLEERGVAVEVFRAPAQILPVPAMEGPGGLLGRLRAYDIVVLGAPVYFDALPAGMQRLLEDLYERRTGLRGIAPRVYGIGHSGFVEPSQRRPILRTMELFTRSMGWSWQGGVGFGGTSPVDGRPLEEVGRLASRLREGLETGAADMAAGEPFSARTIARCGRSPFPFPKRFVIRLINSRTRALGKEHDLTAQPYLEPEVTERS